MPQEYIDQFLRVGSNTENHRTRIAIEYAKQQPMDNLVDFLEKTYHGGYGLQFGTTKVCAWYAEDGIHLAYGSAARFAKNAQILSWENVAARVGQLLERGQFATNVELAECGTFEKRQLAEQLWYMSHDISEKAIEAGHMSIVRSLRGGFPEETEEEFAQTLDFIRKCRFAQMHIFPYSIRPGTPAAKMEQVPKAVKEERARRAAAVAEEMHRSYLEGCVGRTYPVLFEQPKNGKFFGHAPNYMEVLVDGAELHNALRTVRITDVDGEALLGEIVEQEAET